MEKDEARLKKRLSSFYDAEFRRLDKEIASYYQQYGENNVIQYRRLMEALPDSDKRLLIERMDEFAERYPQYADLMPVRESIYKLNRLEGLQYSVRMQQLEIGAVDNEEITVHLNKQALRGANAAAETLGFGRNFYAGSPSVTKLFVDVPWSGGENFSARIWKDTEKLAKYLNADIAQGFARGDSYQRLVRQLRQRFETVSRNNAYRLIYTEGTYVMAESTMYPFTQNFERYRLSTVGDEKVCPICRSISDREFDIKDRQPGINFPPLHPWCRCTFEIVVDNWDDWVDGYVSKQSIDKKQAEIISNRLKGQEEQSIMKLPKSLDAVIPKAKFTEYALNPEKSPDKSRAFKRALGYTADSADDLIEQIYVKLSDFPAIEKGDRGWGMTYEVVMDITGPNGKTAKVLTAWIDDRDSGEMRLTTVHVDD